MRMGDGPPGNIPDGLDAVAGYVDDSGIGVTFPAVVVDFPRLEHLSISVHGAGADCGDVEKGALSSWRGYSVGYCSISRLNAQLAQDGRPPKLWTAHYDPVLGAHRCAPTIPRCVEAAGGRLTETADGTQWTDHGGIWDESLLADDFFDFRPSGGSGMLVGNDNGQFVVVGNDPVTKDLMVFRKVGPAPGDWSVVDVTQVVHNSNPNDPHEYRVE